MIIIGGSSGIGMATAAGLAKEGVKIVVAARRAKEREETVRLISKAENYRGIFADENDVGHW